MKKKLGEVFYYALFFTSIIVLLIRAYWISKNRKENIELFGYLAVVLLILTFGWKLGIRFIRHRRKKMYKEKRMLNRDIARESKER
jgi:hypothetical protein